MLHHNELPIDYLADESHRGAEPPVIPVPADRAAPDDLQWLLEYARRSGAGEAIDGILARCLESAERTHALVTELGRATVGEIEFSSVVGMVIENSRLLAGAGHAALCLHDASSERVQHFGEVDRAVASSELHRDIIELTTQRGIDDEVGLRRSATCSGCPVQGEIGHCLSFPLQVGEQQPGVLCVMRSAGDAPFNQADVAAGRQYAGWAAIALANANRIRATRELARAEREAMVAHLHDNVAQTLSLLNLRVEGVEEALVSHGSPETLSQVRAVKAAVHEVFGQVRTALSDLRAPVSHAKDLVTALTACVEAFRETAGLPVEFVVAGRCELSQSAQVQALNIVREALVNVRRHAQASHVLLEVFDTGHELRIAVQDNGVGFDTAQGRVEHHLGLTIMSERARRSGAHLVIDSVPGCGTRVVLSYKNLPDNEAIAGVGR